MTEAEVIELIHDQLEGPTGDGTDIELTALGMICADIEEFGFEAWMNMPPHKVVEGHIEATQHVAEDLLEDLEAMLKQEKELEVMGVNQSMRIDTIKAVSAVGDGLISVMKSMVLYFATQELARLNYEPTH